MTNAENLPRAYMSPSETRRCNGRITDIASLFLNFAADDFSMEEIDSIAKSCKVTREYAFAELLAARFGVDSGGADRAFFKNYFIPMIHELDTRNFTEDPYYTNVKIPEKKVGKWELRRESLKAGEAFVCRDFTVTSDGRLIPQLGFFAEPFDFPAVLENGREWMTLLPNETVTTLPAVERAGGRVLTYGLGLGYFAYRASEKDCVSSVTVVERSPDVISLFEEYILPQFPHREKIKIVCSDAFDFAEKEAPRRGFDFVFADFWHDAGDGRDLMLKMKEYEKLSPQTEYAYWLEDTINCYLDRDLWP